ncbi:MAG: hypothetical protein JWM14_3275 [Chitinophagaceae bacterium]|nr:hypothetical protein [Chitinophagaceae bacterium]
MIMPYDADYQETKLILLAKASMKSEFRPLADWVDETFGVKTINIVYDTIDNGNRPRLELCFEFEREKNYFLNKDSFGLAGDKQQAIALYFKQTLEEQGIADQYPTENIWIIYGGFEPIARTEANQNIPQEKIDELKRELDNKDLWEISRAFSGVTFFLYTDEQVKQYESSTIKELWANKYFDLLEPYNQFSYFKRGAFTIYLDSKENFDTNYASNWYYYYK